MNQTCKVENEQKKEDYITIKLEESNFKKILLYFFKSLDCSESNPINVTLDITTYNTFPLIESTFRITNHLKIDDFFRYFSTFTLYSKGSLKIEIGNSKKMTKDIIINFKSSDRINSCEIKPSSLSFILYSIMETRPKDWVAVNITYYLQKNSTTGSDTHIFHCSEYTKQCSPHPILFLKDFDTSHLGFNSESLEKLKKCNLYYNLENIKSIRLSFELGYSEKTIINIVFPEIS